MASLPLTRQQRLAVALALLALTNLFAIPIISPMGYTLMIGDSMEPTIPGGCGVAYVSPWDGETPLTDEIVSYTPTHTDFEPEFGNIVAHRVVAEYHDYDMDSADYYITEYKYIQSTSTAPIPTNQSTSQPYDDAKQLEGEHVLVFKGDNNESIDSELIPATNVNGIVESSHMVLDANTWPCSSVMS